MAAKIPGGIKLPHLQTLPAGSRDGEVQYQGNGLWLNDGNSWYPVGGTQYRNQNNGVGLPKMFTGSAVSAANGTFTLDLPVGYFNAVHNVQASCWRTSATAGNPAYAVLISMTTALITGQTLMPASTLLINAAPVTVVGSIGVQVLVVGV